MAGWALAGMVAAVADVSSRARITPTVAGLAAVIASLTGVSVTIPLVAQSKDRVLVRRVSWSIGPMVALGVIGVTVET